MAVDLVSANLKVDFNWNYTNALDHGTPTYADKVNFTQTLTDGTSADNADLLWTDRRTVASAATDNIDLAGALTDAFGQTITIVKLKGLLIVNRGVASGTTFLETTGEDLTIDTSTVPGLDVWAENIEAGGFFAICNPRVGITVTATTNDNIAIVNGGASTITYDIVVIGTSA